MRTNGMLLLDQPADNPSVCSADSSLCTREPQGDDLF